MKYQEGNIVLLYNGKTVYIFSIDETAKKYQAVETDDENKVITVTEDAIYMLVT